jgi:RNA-directed DNA polymerase
MRKDRTKPCQRRQCEELSKARDTRDWSWVEGSVWTDRMVSALGNGVKGGKWYSLMDKVYAPATLAAAWTKVRANAGAAGVDGQSVERFAARAEEYLAELSRSLRAGDDRPAAIRRVEIPKGSGGKRPLGIPTVKDRIAQTAVKFALEPILEARFHRASFGFRPGRGAKDALREVDRRVKSGQCFGVDADLKSSFDTIPHDRLMGRLRAWVSDGRVLDLIDAWLKQGIVGECGRWTPASGTPQGAVISPLLANLYLHPLDERMAELGWSMVRYADDFVVLCSSMAEAQAALAAIQAFVEESGLTLHPNKTHVGDCRIAGQGFEFLGYRFEAGRRLVRKKSLLSLRDRIRAKTRRTSGKSLDRTIADLNPTLKGWFAYFKHATSGLKDVDAFVRRRLRALLRKQQKRPGCGTSPEDRRRWPNAFFAAAGLFTLETALRQARHSR